MLYMLIYTVTDINESGILTLDRTNISGGSSSSMHTVVIAFATSFY